MFNVFSGLGTIGMILSFVFNVVSIVALVYLINVLISLKKYLDRH